MSLGVRFLVVIKLQKLVEASEPYIVWKHLWTGSHEVRGVKFNLQISRIIDGGQMRIYVFKEYDFISYVFDPKHDATCVYGSEIELQNCIDLISEVKVDIDLNLTGIY